MEHRLASFIFCGPKINSVENVDITLPTRWFYVPKKIARNNYYPYLDLIKSTMSLLEEYHNSFDSSVEPATITAEED